MTDYKRSALEFSTARAWRAFQARLADHLAALAEDGSLLVDVGPVGGEEGLAPYVQFRAWGEGMLRGEVSSNHVLPQARQLDAAAEEGLLELGFAAPTHGVDDEPDSGSLNFHVDVDQAEVDRLAVMAVHALREAFGVPHPAFLQADGLEGSPAPVEPSAAELGPEEPAAVFPYGGHAQLQSLVDDAVRPNLGHAPDHDDDGDIPVDVGDTVLYVRVHETVPVVELFGCLVTDVQDLERAAFEVAVLNRDVQFVRFRLVGDSILSYLHLPAWPFAPEHLRAMLAVMTECVNQVADDLVRRVSGRHLVASLDDPTADEEEDELDEAEPGESDVEPLSPSRAAAARASMILLQLDAASPGSVDPALAASICGYDAGVILRVIDADSRDEIAWMKERDEALVRGDTDEAEVCDHEMEHARRTVSLLRRALRVTVERKAARDAVEPVVGPSSLGRDHRSRPRQVPDSTLEEVDPETWG